MGGVLENLSYCQNELACVASGMLNIGFASAPIAYVVEVGKAYLAVLLLTCIALEAWHVNPNLGVALKCIVQVQ